MAANYLDSLVVQFAIDSKGAVDGAKEVEKAVDSLTDSAQEGGAAAEGAAKSTERAFQRTDQAMRRTGAALKETLQSVEGNNRAIDGSGRSIVETGRKVVKTTERTNKTMDRSREKNVRNAKDMGASQERLAETLGKVRGEAVSLLAIFTAGRGMKEFLSSTTATSAAAGRMAHNLGMSTQDLTAWQTVARESGGTAEGMTGSLQGLVDQFQTISGRTNLTQVFSRIGVNLEDGNGKLRDRTQIMMDLADKFSSMDPTQANSWGRMLGFDQGTINTLERGRKALSGLYAEARRNGITDQQAQAFALLQQDWVQLTTQSDALGRSILANLAPAFHAVLHDTSEFIDKYPDYAKGIAVATAGLGGMAAVLGSIASVKLGGRLLGLLGSACTCGEGGGAGGKKPSAGRSAAKDAAETAGGEAAAKKAGTSVMRRVGRTALRGAGKALRVAPWIAIPYEILAEATPTAKDDTIPRGSNALRSAVSDTSRFGVFAQSVAKIEGARYNQMGGYNNAYAGKYQMGEGAIQDAARSLHEAVPSQSQFLGDPDMQERYFRAYTGLNEKTLWARSDTFRNASDARKMEILGYAHNQGAGGALKWLKTGVAARDGFGTRADRYANEIHSSFAANGMLNNMQPMIQHAAGPVNNSTSNTQTIHVDAITVNAHGANPDSVVRAIHHEFGAAATLGHQTATRLG